MPHAGRHFRYGWLHALPADYVGERHVAIVSHEPTTSPLIEWCVFEERPGRGGGIDPSDAMTVFLTEPGEQEPPLSGRREELR